MIILGIDPGTSRIGYGVIKETNKPKLIRYGTIESKQQNLYGKIAEFSLKFERLLKESKPDAVAIEKLFFTKNRKTAIAVAQARGVLLAHCISQNKKIIELGPMQIKQLVTGYGKSDKIAVAKMVKKILDIPDLQGYDDASDAIAIALAGSQQEKLTKKVKIDRSF